MFQKVFSHQLYKSLITHVNFKNEVEIQIIPSRNQKSGGENIENLKEESQNFQRKR